MSWFAYEEYTERFERCAQYLHGRGRELSGYDTVSIAVDGHELVSALGLDKVNIWSESYGTRVGSEWMRMHPEDLRAVTMYAVLTPEAGNWGYSFPKNLYGTMKKVFSACARDERCRAKYPELERKFREALDRLNDSPLEVNIDIERLGLPNRWLPTRTLVVDDVLFVSILAMAASHWEGVRKMPMLIEAALEGQKEPITQFIEERILSDTLSFLEPVQYKVLHCNDLGPTDPERWAKETRDVRFLGRWLDGEGVCNDLPYKIRPALPKTKVVSDVPTLMLVGASDPVTPPE